MIDSECQSRCFSAIDSKTLFDVAPFKEDSSKCMEELEKAISDVFKLRQQVKLETK